MAKLTGIQRVVADAYCGGEFSYIEDSRDAKDVGDTLFLFLIREAGGAEDLQEFHRMCETSIDEIRGVQAAVFDKITGT